MRNILKSLRQHLLAGEDLVLVTVIASSGSTPPAGRSRNAG